MHFSYLSHSASNGISSMRHKTKKKGMDVRAAHDVSST